MARNNNDNNDSDAATGRFLALRRSGFRGPIDRNGNAVMSRTDRHGRPLDLFRGGSGRGTPDDKRQR